MAYEVIDDLKYKGRVLFDLVSQPTVEVAGPADHRGAIALQDEISYDLVTPTKLSMSHSDVTHPHVHKVGFIAVTHKTGHHDFDGETVIFAGVEPTVLELSELVSSNPDKILFASDLKHVARFPMRRVWVPGDVPGYTFSGKTMGPYREHIRNPRKDPGSCEAQFSVRKGISIPGGLVEKIEFQPVMIRVPVGSGKPLSEPCLSTETSKNEDERVMFEDGTRGPKSFDPHILDKTGHRYDVVIQISYSENGMDRVGKKYDPVNRVWTLDLCAQEPCYIHQHHFERMIRNHKGKMVSIEYHSSPEAHVRREGFAPVLVPLDGGGGGFSSQAQLGNYDSHVKIPDGFTVSTTASVPSKRQKKNRRKKKPKDWKETSKGRFPSSSTIDWDDNSLYELLDKPEPTMEEFFAKMEGKASDGLQGEDHW